MTTVNGQEIPQAAIDFELKRLIQFYSQHMPEDQVRKQMGVLRERAKEQAIGAKLLFEEANRLEVAVSDEDVAQRVAAMTEQVGGEERLRAMLQKQGSNTVEFSEQIRRGRRVDKLIEQVTADIRDPSEDDMRQHFEAHREEYTKSEQAQAQHILIRATGSDADAKLEALGRLNTLRSRLEGGADFAELAAAHSECPSGKQAGGSLGWFSRGAMVPAFDEAVFAMDVGAMSPAVETQFGFHLIKKTGHQAAEAPEFEEAREQVRDFLRHSVRGEALAAYVSELRDKAKIEES